MEVDVSGDDDYNNTLSWRDQNFRIQQKMLWHDGFQKEATPAINDFYSTLNDIKNLAAELKLKQPQIFFSYSWPMFEKPHETWIQQSLVKLYKHFELAGLNPKLDLLDSKVGHPSYQFMLESKQADWVILAFSETFQAKMNKPRPMLKTEMDMHNDRWQDEVREKEEQGDSFQSAIIPCLFSGEYRKSAPYGWQRDQACEILRDKSYARNFFHLVGLFYGLSNNATFQQTINQFFEQHPTHAAPILKKRIHAYIEQEKKQASQQAAVQARSWEEGFSNDQEYQKAISTFWSQNIKLAAIFPEKARALFSRSVWSLQQAKHEEDKDDPTIASVSVKVNKQLPDITSTFVPRPNIMHRLLTLLEARHANMSIKPQVIMGGIGGAGKTQLALYAIHQYERFAKQLRWWFPSETVERLVSAYANFARDVGILRDDEKVTPEIICQRVKYWLENNPGWFVVYDNAENYKSIRHFLPHSGGQILITSRSKKWPKDFATINVDKMTEDVAIRLLKKITEYKDADDQFKILAKELGYLAKALAHAGSYMKERRISVSDYLKIYHENLPRALGNTVTTTWDISMDAIEESASKNNKNSYALEILTLCSYLNPDNIPQKILINWLNNQPRKPTMDDEGDDVFNNDSGDKADYYDIQGILLSYHMIEVDKNNKNISLHRVIHDILRTRHQEQIARNEELNSQLIYFHHIAKCLLAQFSPTDDAAADESRRINLLPHSETFMHYYDLYYPKQDQYLIIADLLDSIAVTKFYLLGNAEQARKLLRRTLRIRENIHQLAKTKDTAATLGNLANTEGTLGNLEEKERLLKVCLDMLEHCLYEGINQAINKLRHIRNDIHLKTADDYKQEIQEIDDPPMADEIKRIAIENTELFFMNNQIEICCFLGNLGNAYGTLCRVNKARYALELGMEFKELFYSRKSPQYGRDHPQVARSLMHVAYIYGSPFKLRGCFESTLTNHLYSLYFWWYRAKLEADLDKAEIMLERSLKIHHDVFGKTHHSTAAVLIRLSWAYKYKEKPQARRKALNQALEIQIHHYGKDSLRLIETYELLIDTCISLQKIDLAKQHFKTALNIIRQQAGGAHSYIQNLREQFSKILYPQPSSCWCILWRKNQIADSEEDTYTEILYSNQTTAPHHQFSAAAATE